MPLGSSSAAPVIRPGPSRRNSSLPVAEPLTNSGIFSSFTLMAALDCHSRVMYCAARFRGLIQLVFRFFVGGLIVLRFLPSSAMVLTPESFAGIFGATPSVALATLALTTHIIGVRKLQVPLLRSSLGMTPELHYGTPVAL